METQSYIGRLLIAVRPEPSERRPGPPEIGELPEEVLTLSAVLCQKCGAIVAEHLVARHNETHDHA